jgi:carboxypeptidase Taq
MGAKLDKFRELLGEIYDLNAAVAVLGWDQQTYMPEGGSPARALQLSTLSMIAHDKFVGDEFGAALEAARLEAVGLDPDSDEVRIVARVQREFEKQRKVSSEWVGEFSRVTALAHPVWQKARAESDFAQFRPALEAVVKLRRAYVDFFRPYEHVYDPLLDDFEPRLTTAEVKAVFTQLRQEQVALVRAIADRGRPVDDSILHRPYDVQKQWDFGVEVAKKMGFDFERGRQDKSTHPFTTAFSIDDVRITTRFDPDYIASALFSTMHESGHALYEQGVSHSLARTPLATGASYAIHESQSRMWENFVGRSHAFWVAFFPRLQQAFPENLHGARLDDFYRAINKVEPSLIRVEADEATYNLHIMLRFEIEIALMEDSLSVADLPGVWNARMQEYLGLTPPNDALGVLQDIHWSGGSLGYFPTYALGNLVAAQLWEKAVKDIPDLERQIEKGKFEGLLAWLRENVHRHGGKFEPMDLLKRVTGHALTPEPYIRYLKAKFSQIYGLK